MFRHSSRTRALKDSTYPFRQGGADGRVRRTVRIPGTGIYDTKVVSRGQANRRRANRVMPPNQHQFDGPPPAGWYRDPYGGAFRRYWDGRAWTPATDEPGDFGADVGTGAAGEEPAAPSITSSQWSHPPDQEHPNAERLGRWIVRLLLRSPHSHQNHQNSTDPEAPYGRDPVTGKPLSDRKATTAAALQLFLGMFGAGRFFIGSTTIAAWQLGLTILGFVLAQITAHYDTASGFVGMLLVGVIVWGFVDAIRTLMRSIPDGQGLKLR